MKNKIKGLLVLALILAATVGLLIFNLSKLFSNNNRNLSSNTVIVDENSDSGDNVSIDDYYNISNNKDEIPIENGKVLSEIYTVDIPNFSIVGEYYGWTEDASRLNYDIIANSILLKIKKDAKYEVVPESITPLDLENDINMSFKCRDFYTKKELFTVGITRQGRAIVEEIKNIVQ